MRFKLTVDLEGAIEALKMPKDKFQKLLQEQETIEELLDRVHTIEISLMSMVHDPASSGGTMPPR